MPDEEDYRWQSQAKDGTEIVVRCVEDGISYSYVLTETKQAVVTVQREKWDWDRQVLMGERDVTVLPDFVQQDSFDNATVSPTGTQTLIFKADNTRNATIQAAEDYTNLLLGRGYKLIEKESKASKSSTRYKWFLTCDDAGLGRMDKVDHGAHVAVKVMVYHNCGDCHVSIRCAKGVTMNGYGSASPHNNDDECCYCDDGDCRTCNGTGQVRKNVPGTTEWILQNCTLCNHGKCRRCGGDGKRPY